MSIFKKIRKSVKKYVKNIGGIKKASPLNPFTHGYHTAKKLYNGINNKTWSKNVSKYLTGASRHDAGNASGCCGVGSSASDVYGPTGSIVGRY